MESLKKVKNVTVEAYLAVQGIVVVILQPVASLAVQSAMMRTMCVVNNVNLRHQQKFVISPLIRLAIHKKLVLEIPRLVPLMLLPPMVLLVAMASSALQDLALQEIFNVVRPTMRPAVHAIAPHAC